MGKKRGKLLSNTSSEEIDTPEAVIIEDNEFNMKIRNKIPKSKMIRNFNFLADMKHKREIKLKSPRLRALRNALREILYLEWNERARAIVRAQSDLLDTRLPQSEKLKFRRELETELGENKIIMKSSIVMCGWCHHRDKDAIYNPSNRQWFCPDCYIEHKQEILSAESYIY